MARLTKPREGGALHNQPNGIPLFFEGNRSHRIVTANPWSFLRQCAREYIAKKDYGRACAYIDQALDFYQAAENPRVGSKPLLYYYSFMNLAKFTLLVYGTPIPLRLQHGIEDPAANTKQRLRIAGQQVRIYSAGTKHSQVFPEFWKLVGGGGSRVQTISVLDILAQVPSIHRTYTRVSGRRTLLLPIQRVEAMGDGTHVWLKLTLRRHDRDVDLTLRGIRRRPIFRSVFTQVEAPRDSGSEFICFETEPSAGRRRGVDRALASVSAKLFEVPFTTVLTGSGYRLYMCDLRPSEWLHPLASIYTGMFYLGSVTRYKPDIFGKILSGGYAWIVEEFISTAPMQFLYVLSSTLAGAEVVRPYAAFR